MKNLFIVLFVLAYSFLLSDSSGPLFEHKQFFNISCNKSRDCDIRRGLVCSSSKLCRCQSNYPFFDTRMMICLPKCPKGSLIDYQTSECFYLGDGKFDFTKTGKSFDEDNDYTCKKCESSEFYDWETHQCKMKIKSRGLCSKNTDQCLTQGYYCLKEEVTDTDLICINCEYDQYIDLDDLICKNTFYDLDEGEACSLLRDSCKSPFQCMKKTLREESHTCQYCDFNPVYVITGTDTYNLLCSKRIQNGKTCKSKDDICLTEGYYCLKKKSKDRKYYCIKCSSSQYVDINSRTCKTKIKSGEVCPSENAVCRASGYYCLKKTVKDTRLLCRKCESNIYNYENNNYERQFIDSNRICRKAILPGNKCSPKFDVCHAGSYYWTSSYTDYYCIGS